MAAEINLRLTSAPESVTSARHALDRLAEVLPPEKLEDLRLVVSELVTNSVRHARGSSYDQILLSVSVSAGSVEGRVCDSGPGFEVPYNPKPRSDLKGGWGLPIVENISDCWGVERCVNGERLACVWFEIK